MADSLTKRQRQILGLMLEHGPASFYGGTRGFGWRVVDYGVVIKAYMQPELFLERRGLIVSTPTNTPGRWHRLTAEGETRARRLQRLGSGRRTET